MPPVLPASSAWASAKNSTPRNPFTVAVNKFRMWLSPSMVIVLWHLASLVHARGLNGTTEHDFGIHSISKSVPSYDPSNNSSMAPQRGEVSFAVPTPKRRGRRGGVELVEPPAGCADHAPPRGSTQWLLSILTPPQYWTPVVDPVVVRGIVSPTPQCIVELASRKRGRQLLPSPSSSFGRHLVLANERKAADSSSPSMMGE
mmetsp:Transcript_13621/g.32979  ORF Transcript_13621/g.32979 Transcript_13621/m.32979 type:complete len:201 (+) Transcript_13621:747-1349(+)